MVHDERTFRRSRAGVLGGVTAGAVVLSLVELILDKELTVSVFVAGGTRAIGRQLTAIGALDMRHFDRDFAPTNHLLSAGPAVGVRRFVAQGLAGYGAYVRTGPGTSIARGGEQFELVRRRRFPLVGDDPVPVAGWQPALAQTLGAKQPMRVPRLIGRLFAGEVGVVMTDARGASNAKAKRELGWRPAHPSWRQGFAAT